MNANITFAADFSYWEAGVAAGLDMWMWETGKYPTWFMAKAVVWHKYHELVKTHSEDAAQKAAKK